MGRINPFQLDLFLTPPDFADPDRTLMARQVFSVLRAFTLFAAVLLIIQVFVVPGISWRWLGLLLATVAFSTFLLYGNRQGHVRMASFLLVAELWLLISVFSWTAHGLGARAAWGYFIVVFIAGMVLGKWQGIATAGVCSASTLLIALEAPIRSNDPFRFWLVNTLYLVIVLLLQELAGRSIRDSLATAHSELHERQLAESELRKSENRFKSIVESSPMGMHMYELQGPDRLVFVGANPAADKILGIDNHLFIGKTIEEAFPSLKSTEVPERYRMAARNGTFWKTEQVNYEDRSIKGVFEVFAFQISPGKMVALFNDISERKRAEDALLDRSRFISSLLRAIPVAVFFKDKEGKYTGCNDAFTEIMGVTSDEIKGKTVHEIWPSELADTYHRKDLELMQEKKHQVYEFQVIDKNGAMRPVIYAKDILLDADGEVGGLVGAFLDISDRKLAEEKLLESERRYRTLFESAGDSIFLLHGNRIIDCNSKTLEMFGCAREQIIGLPISRFHPFRQPDGSDSLVKGKEKNTAALAGKSQFFEWRHVRFDGTFFDAEVSLTRIELAGEGYLLAMVRDISERKRLEEQLRQAQKMEAVGILAGGVAHDFNNILSTIVGYGSLLQMKLKEEGLLKGYVERILGASERAANLTSSLLAFSRKQEIELQSLDLNDVIYGFHKILARLIGEDIDFSLSLASTSLVVDADVRQIEQVLMNLANNSRDAMPRGGRLTISTSAVSLDPAPGDLPPGPYAAIAVADTGTGMEMEIQARIFEPFFTTKDVGKGTGLGLAIVYGIVKNHGGVVTVDSAPGKGTTFTIYLPLISQPKKKAERRKQEKIPTGSETILVIEDDPAVRQVTRSLLEEFGYVVLEAADGIAAQDIFRSEQERIELVLCDLIMPKRNGRETVAAIQKMKRGVKAIFMSGYTADIIADKGIADVGMHLLLKPLNPGVLLKKIRAILDKR